MVMSSVVELAQPASDGYHGGVTENDEDATALTHGSSTVAILGLCSQTI
jgi:hypothetical protein